VLFNSPEFAVFLAFVLLVWSALRALDARSRRGTRTATRAWLLVASYAFYMSWNPLFVLLIVFSTLLDFALALRLEASQREGERRLLVLASCLGNLGVLGFFKYGSFAWGSASALLGFDYRPGDVAWLDVALPVGISFYTFQTLSYTIDVYRRQQPATRNLLDFAVYVSFFPQLVAGPIVRARQLLPQIETPRSPRAAEVEAGIARIVTGLVKKVVFADGLGAWVDLVHADPASADGITAALAIYAYAFQIYFDFSGYTDMAIGTAKLFGISLPENFDRPFRAASLQEFWRRWHITLSTWLRDYLYIPLGGNRTGHTAVNLFVTMLLGGLWHGAAWTFVLWGALHGALLGVERALRARGVGAALPDWTKRVITFHLVAVAFTLFRATSVGAFFDVMAALGRPGTWALPSDPTALHAFGLLAIAAALHLLSPATFVRERLVRLPAWSQGVVYAAALVLVFLSAPATARFIYFQF
jgi:D-alanyl-lipoteichoic acid acyltransferase DltB (MBOAT superfamily)